VDREKGKEEVRNNLRDLRNGIVLGFI